MRYNIKSYLAGYIVSVALTLAAYGAVAHPEYFRLATGSAAMLAVILALAVIQLVAQMLFFLHVGSQPSRAWKLIIFFSTLALVLIIVIGSLWIMNHLNYSMTPAEVNQYINNQQGGF